jgi:dTDP-4-dehydrorhamnose reductase
MMNTARRMLITGGTGYVGRALIAQAARAGWHVHATHHSQPPASDAATWHALDIRDASAVQSLCTTVQPDCVIHTAFRQRDPDMWAITAVASAHVATAAHAVGAHLIHMSSDMVFDGMHDTPYTEAAPPAPITPYGGAKAAAEALVAALHPTCAIVRTSLVYGFEPIDRHTQLVFDTLEGRSAAVFFLDEYRCPIWIVDLTAALLELVALSYTGIIHIAGAEPLNRHAFSRLLAAYHRRDPDQVPAGWSRDHLPPRPRTCMLDVQHAQMLLTTPLRGAQAVLAP